MIQWFHSRAYVEKLKTIIQKDTCTLMFIAVLLAKTWKDWETAIYANMDGPKLPF